jgi:hypothetical protein
LRRRRARHCELILQITDQAMAEARAKLHGGDKL